VHRRPKDLVYAQKWSHLWHRFCKKNIFSVILLHAWSVCSSLAIVLCDNYCGFAGAIVGNRSESVMIDPMVSNDESCKQSVAGCTSRKSWKKVRLPTHSREALTDLRKKRRWRCVTVQFSKLSSYCYCDYIQLYWYMFDYCYYNKLL